MCCLAYFYLVLCYLSIISENNFVQSECKGIYVVFCESINDLEYESSESKDSWIEVTVGNVAQIHNYVVKKYYFPQINVKKWTIVNQFNVLDVDFYVPQKSISLIFYGNNFKNIRLTFDLWHKLDFLSLPHNNIENIDLALAKDTSNYGYGPTISVHDMTFVINTIDLSSNKLKETESGKFCSKAKADELILSDNQLWLIRPKCLPRGLKRLRLNHNEFVYFSNINLNSHNLTQLEFLTVAHNKLQAVDDLPSLDALYELDLSFNNIFIISDVFGSLDKLRILNLKYNNLIRFSLPNLLSKTVDVNYSQYYRIILSFNRLRNLDVSSIKNSNFSLRVHLSLAGNPWNCKCIDNLRSQLSEMTHVTLAVNDCLPNQIPYCVINQFYGEPCSNEQISENTLNILRNITRQITTC